MFSIQSLFKFLKNYLESIKRRVGTTEIIVNEENIESLELSQKSESNKQIGEWKKVGEIAVGGLREVGFSNNEDYIISLSSNGRGIFSCLDGKKVARDHDDYYMNQYDSSNGIVEGFDCLSEEKIVCCGLEFEDFLKKETGDGWKVIKNPPEPDEPPFERYNVEKVYLQNKLDNKMIYITKISICELRAYGFSNNGMTLIVATSCTLEVWNRR